MIATTLEFNGRQYQAASRHQKGWGERVIAGLALRGNETILDLGCGDGALSELLARRVPAGRVVGIDASWGMIETARRRRRDNLSFELMRMEYLNAENAFDVVFSNAALHWVHDHRRLLASVHRCLRPGGVVRFNFAGAGNCARLEAALRRAAGRAPFADDLRNFAWPWFMPSVEEYVGLVAQVPFRESRIWLEDADHVFASPEEMIGWIDQPCLVPFLAALPERQRMPFRTAVVEDMLGRARRWDGRYVEIFRRINLYAKK